MPSSGPPPRSPTSINNSWAGSLCGSEYERRNSDSNGSWTHNRVTAPGGAPAVRLVALDMDGTILERGRVIQPALVEALVRAARAGVRVTTCTGRPIEFQRQLLPENGLGPGAGVPHALVADERELFLLDTATGAYESLEPWNTTVRERWKTLHPAAMDWLRRAEREAQARSWVAAPHESEARMYERGLPTLALQDAETAAEIRRWLAGQLAESGDALVANRNGRLVQLHDAATGKGLVLLELARVWDIQPSEVLAAGDSANDFTMLDGRHGFRAMCPANADDGIKDAVRTAGGYIAGERIGLGVLEGLRHYGVA